MKIISIVSSFIVLALFISSESSGGHGSAIPEELDSVSADYIRIAPPGK